MTHNNPKLTAKIALYQPDIPQNTASIIRTCSCLGVKLEIIEPCGFTFHDKRFRRVVMDYLDEKMIKNIQEDINEIQSTLEALLDLETSGSNTEGSDEVLVNDLIKGVVVGTDIVFQDKKEIKVFSNSKMYLNHHYMQVLFFSYYFIFM